LGRALGWIEQLGRWAMLDVFVVALLVVAIQASLISEVAMHSGIYVFTAAVLVSILTVQRMARLARQAQAAHEN
jgi:paraquat-inducible protein A